MLTLVCFRRCPHVLRIGDRCCRTHTPRTLPPDLVPSVYLFAVTFVACVARVGVAVYVLDSDCVCYRARFGRTHLGLTLLARFRPCVGLRVYRRAFCSCGVERTTPAYHTR